MKRLNETGNTKILPTNTHKPKATKTQAVAHTLCSQVSGALPSCQIIPITYQLYMYHPDQGLLVIRFEMSPVLTPTQQRERKWSLWAPWQCDCEGNCLVLADLHAGGELLSRVWRKSVLSTVPQAALRARRSDSELTLSLPFWRVVSLVSLHFQKLMLTSLKGEEAAVKEVSVL